MDAKELARETLRVLAMQREYFKFRRPELLAESKAAEAKLKQACGEVLNPPTSHQPDLFGEKPAPPSDRFADFERRMAEWHARKYGDRPVDVPRTFTKLVEEIGEVAEAVLLRDAPHAVAVEAADVVIVLFHLVRGVGESLTAALLEKAAVIEGRLRPQEATSHKE